MTGPTVDHITALDAYREERAAGEAAGRGEPEWLVTRRGDAGRAFTAIAMPTPALRPWRYTDTSLVDLGAFEVSSAPLHVEATAPAAGPAGSYAGPLLAGLDSIEALRAAFGSVVPATEGKFEAANAARWVDGAAVYVPRGQAFEAPVVITLDASALGGVAIFPRVLIVAEEQAEVTVVLRATSGAAPLLAAGVVEILAEQAARVRLLVDDRWGADTRDVTTVRARLGRDADVQVASLAIGGSLFKQTVECMLEGEGANSVIRAVALGDAAQHFDFVTLQDHIGARTTSDVSVKSALAGASRSVYYGITRVGEGAAGADANQRNDNLLLSGRAKADSDPVLEILTADVIRCGHGATVGPVDEEALFYLQSRGLDRRAALQLLVAGFFQSVVGDMPLPGLEDELQTRVVEKLEAAEL